MSILDSKLIRAVPVISKPSRCCYLVLDLICCRVSLNGETLHKICILFFLIITSLKINFYDLLVKVKELLFFFWNSRIFLNPHLRLPLYMFAFSLGPKDLHFRSSIRSGLACSRLFFFFFLLEVLGLKKNITAMF